MEGQDIRGLIEAYSQVYEAPEVLNEKVGAGIVALQRQQAAASAAAEKKALQSGKMLGVGGAAFGTQTGTKVKLDSAATRAQGRTVLSTARANPRGGGLSTGDAGPAGNKINLGGQTLYKAKLGGKDVYVGPKAAKPTTPAASRPTTPAASRPTSTPAASRPTSTPAASRPTSTPAASRPTSTPAATAAPKPTPTPAKPVGSAMDQWAAANPKLAAAKAERDRTRGTSATTNPLMKDMKSSMPAPKAPAPSTAKTGFDLAKKGTNLAAGIDIFDLVKGHLLDEGYAETEQNAIVMMANMSEEWRKSILEAHGVEILDEAQEARENPEKHEEEKEKEDEKKYGKVRGEKTPMPPRGDKRREDFEKWYAKHVR
jgi:hypothetical protein